MPFETTAKNKSHLNDINAANHYSKPLLFIQLEKETLL